MKNLICFVFTLTVLASLIGCGQKKSETDAGKVIFDTVPVTNITITPEYYFSGDFTYLADAAVLKESATDANLPVAMAEVYPEAEKQYQMLEPTAGTPVYAEFRGYLKNKGVDEEGPDRQLVITQVITMEKKAKGQNNELITGTYVAPEQTLVVNPDHTYKLQAKDGESERGNWFLSTEDIIVFVTKDGHTIMNVNPAKKSFSTHDDIPVVFRKK